MKWFEDTLYARSWYNVSSNFLLYNFHKSTNPRFHDWFSIELLLPVIPHNNERIIALALKNGVRFYYHSNSRSGKPITVYIMKVTLKYWFRNLNSIACTMTLYHLHNQYGTVYKRPENRVHSRNSAIYKIMHCYLGPIIVVHFLSTCDCLGFYTWIHRSLGVNVCT